jgi:hypothetical protein
MPIPDFAMTARVHHRIDFDELMRLLTVTGFVALATWTMASTVGVISGYVAVSPPATLRFLLAVLVLVFARRTYWELREWRWNKLPPDERFGFTSPLWDGERPSDLGFEPEQALGAEAEGGDGTSTGSQQRRA